MEAECEAESRGVQSVTNRGEMVAGMAHHVEDRAEHFLLQVTDVRQFEGCSGQEEGASANRR